MSPHGTGEPVMSASNTSRRAAGRARRSGRMAGTLLAASALGLASGGGTQAATTVDVTVKETAGVGADQYPTTVVIPLPVGQYQDTSGFSLGVPAQFEVLERWATKDNSIRHVAAHFQATTPPGGQAIYTFRTDSVNPAPPQPVELSSAGSAITVTTGPLRFVVDSAAFNILDTVWYDLNQDGSYDNGERIILPSSNHGARVVACDNVGTNNNCSVTETQNDSALPPDLVTIEESGPMRAVIRLERFTRYNGADDHKHGYVVRIYAYAGKPYVKLDYQVINAATPDSYNTLNGGKWAGPWYFESLGLQWNLQLSGAGTVRTGLAGSAVDTRALGTSGVEFAYTRHDNYALRTANGSANYATCTDGATDATNDCDTAGFMDVTDGNWGVQVAMRNMWELWPAGFQATDPTNHTLEVQLFPDWSGNWHNGAQQAQYWLDDMQAVYKEVLLHFHGPVPSDASLTALARTFDRYPVPTLPLAHYRSTAVTLDLGGHIPLSVDPDPSAPLEVNWQGGPNNDMLESSGGYRMGWRRWYGDDAERIADAETGGVGPVSAEEFVISASPQDYWRAERWVVGDLNTRPIWMGKDYSVRRRLECAASRPGSVQQRSAGHAALARRRRSRRGWRSLPDQRKRALCRGSRLAALVVLPHGELLVHREPVDQGLDDLDGRVLAARVRRRRGGRPQEPARQRPRDVASVAILPRDRQHRVAARGRAMVRDAEAPRAEPTVRDGRHPGLSVLDRHARNGLSSCADWRVFSRSSADPTGNAGPICSSTSAPNKSGSNGTGVTAIAT